jgi:hypothetical protein
MTIDNWIALVSFLAAFVPATILLVAIRVWPGPFYDLVTWFVGVRWQLWHK